MAFATRHMRIFGYSSLSPDDSDEAALLAELGQHEPREWLAVVPSTAWDGHDVAALGVRWNNVSVTRCDSGTWLVLGD